MHWHYVLEQDGSIVDEQEGDVMDKFAQMLQTHPDQRASISATVQRSLPYGEIKCSFTVTVQCPQSQEWLDAASREAFKLALNYLNQGFSYLAPEVPPFRLPP